MTGGPAAAPPLARVDGRLREQLARVRAPAAATSASADGPDPLAGYYISEAEIEQILAGPGFDLPELDRGRLSRLADAFELTPFDTDVVLTCLAPEIDRRFGRLYAYLHDDVTRRAPSVDLVLTLWCTDGAARLAARARLAPGAPLRRHGLVRLDETGEPRPASMLECALRLDPRLARHLLGDDDPDDRLAAVLVRAEPDAPVDTPPPVDATGGLPPDHVEELLALFHRAGPEIVVYLDGPAGSGRAALARAFARALARPLLVARCDGLAGEPPARVAELVRLVGREARLRGAVTCWRDADRLGADDRRAAFAEALADGPGPVLVGGLEPWDGPEPARRPFARLRFDRPDAEARHRLWSAALDGAALDKATLDETDPPDAAALAAAFRFTAGQIREAVAAGVMLALTRDPAAPRLRQADLATACRTRSGRELAHLARHVVTSYGWDDLVLPPERMAQLRELADQVRHRGLVHDTWAFGRAVAPAGGIIALFAGPPGTGKTMAASVLANALGVDLYAIDLATTVSKYIGETEKNLGRVFEAAADSNAVLFFDEADALFGRRTQVRDAHDRYANIETSYLLQRIETHPGVVILATNLRKNMDEAFVRRFRATLEFPPPGEAERLRIWERIWPSAAPRAADVDLGALARAIDLPGGHIRNIVLGGAFLAAADGGIITMAHLLRATRGEYEKLGKIISPGELTGVAPRHDEGRGARAHISN
ncbi:ATP-binding protein [Pseudofrankia inefficax]|uniref:AAA ATPase central domain protein n=1 Tax=Pseudofrankia inefficax (strain DSM 45817 / CECT 9037 / DDB 130130 / EuI1c) TaxID=298654 RepID=E3IXD0_PSEI1|nr:ATP-binding protein [Pseudofrankia inefficax]ADP85030.1 AAA ATPase central domain protein [Pseudofrankia inefficax]